MNYLVQGREVIFNLAGQVSHIDSMRDPHTDLEINCRSQLTLLEACRRHNPATKVVYASTRQIYGRPDALPVTERHLVRPTDVNGINKAAGEDYHLVYNNVFGVRATALRLTNIYGPRQLLRHNRQGFIGWFIRLAIEDQEIQVFGDGSQIRDFVYVDDAVDAFLRAGASDAVNGEAFNVGGDEHFAHRDLVELLVRTAGTGRYRFVEWPRGQEGDRHRQLLRRLDALQDPDRLGAADRPGRRASAHHRLLPPADGRSMSDPRRVPFNALKPGEDRADVAAAIARVIDSGWFILGPEVERFEAAFAAACGAAHAVGVGTGTDAITLTLRALDIGPGDEVITAPLSAAYSALAVMMAGARPVFADIDPGAADARSGGSGRGRVTSRTKALLPGAPLRPACRHDSADGAGRAASPGARRRLRAGAPGDERRPPGGHDGRGRRVQLLSDEEPRRAGRRRSGGHRRRGAGGAHQAAAQRRPDHALSPRRSRREQPPRRDAGGHPARAPRAPRAGGPPAGARLRRPTGPGLSAHGISVPPEFDAGHVYHLFPVLTPHREAVQAHLAASGRRDVHPLPGADPAPARAGGHRSSGSVPSPIGSARRSCRCPCIPR